jgi:cell division transport system ATP-binding protein
MLNHPELILADEPTGQLDAESGERVMALLDEIRRRANCTLIISTHNLQWPEIFPGIIYTCDNGFLVRKNMPQQQLLP